MKKLLLSLLCIGVLNSFAQIQINTTGNYSNPSYLIDNVLIGNGVTTSNHLYTGDPSQIGFFTDSMGLIGMDSGFVLSTGGVDSIGNIGVDTMPWWNYIWDSLGNIIDSTPVVNSYHLTGSFNGAGDADLLTIANSVPGLIGQSFVVSATLDAAILEFDFVPSSDTVEFNYVFASEEYLGFVNSSFNDVFSFFISGPGITGPYASPAAFPGGAINIAEVPNSSPILPITISTVNDTLNSQYYNHDTFAVVSAFNGYTDVFTAKAAVQACNVYHIKLAIADGTDGSYDSGVFFEAGSFDATEPGALGVTAITTDLQCYGDTNGTALVCISGGVAPYIINWNGNNPNNLAAGSYNVFVTDVQGSSGGANFTINSPAAITASVNQPNIDLESNVMGGTPNYTYNWTFNGVSVGTASTYTPTQNGDYTLMVTDSNGCTITTDPFSVTNIVSGIMDILNNKFMVYPNPFSEKTTVKLLSSTDRIVEISLFDPSGRKVKDFTHNSNSDKVIVEKGNLKKGIYLLVIQTENYISKSKLIIE